MCVRNSNVFKCLFHKFVWKHHKQRCVRYLNVLGINTFDICFIICCMKTLQVEVCVRNSNIFKCIQNAAKFWSRLPPLCSSCPHSQSSSSSSSSAHPRYDLPIKVCSTKPLKNFTEPCVFWFFMLLVVVFWTCVYFLCLWVFLIISGTLWDLNCFPLQFLLSPWFSLLSPSPQQSTPIQPPTPP